MNATFLRPWYDLGPKAPGASCAAARLLALRAMPGTRETARRLGLVTLSDMVEALVRAIETPVRGVRIVEVPEIRRRKR